jgi:hypothetical protein
MKTHNYLSFREFPRMPGNSEFRRLIFVGNFGTLPMLTDTCLFVVRSSFVFRKFCLLNAMCLLCLYVYLSLSYLRLERSTDFVLSLIL